MARRLAPLAVLAVALASCTDAPSFAAFVAYDNAHMSAGTGSSGGDDPEGTTAADSTGAETGADTATSGAAGTDGASGGEDSTTAADAELAPPRILAVDVPATVHLAGPVALAVTAEHATAVRGTLDGVELEPFEDQGGGVWLGQAPCLGSVDNGDHVVEVTATNGPLADVWPPVAFTVSTPAPGGQAWAQLAASGTATRAAVTPEGDLLEVGAVEVAGVLKPSIRKRAAKNGAELWTIVLDDREGSAVAVAVAPDGHLWVALNVKNPNKKWQPRIVQLDAEGLATGVEVSTEPGATVRSLAADAEGVVAVGFDGSGFGDMDVVTWRMRHDGTAVYTAKRWDYAPVKDGEPQAHDFDDLAFDVVIVDGAAWVVGASTGYHDENQVLYTRGIVVRMDLETGVALGPATVADPVNTWSDSMFLAAAQHPAGIIVTGNESSDGGTLQRITVQAFNAAGGRVYYLSEWSAPVAYGTGVAWSAEGVALAVGVVHDGDVLRGVLYARGGLGSAFDYVFPGSEPSAAYGLALDSYRQAFLVGERTISGVRQARAVRVHR